MALKNPETTRVRHEVLSDDRYSIRLPRVGKALLSTKYEPPGSISLIALEVYQDHRGKGIGRFLFRKAVQTAQEQGYQQLTTMAANERTASCFKLFEPDQLEFSRLNPQNDQYEPLEDISLHGVIQYLQINRMLRPQESADSMLDIGVHDCVRIQAQL